MGTRLIDILFDLPEALNPESFSLIGTTKSASIIRAAHRDLEDEAVCLAGGPKDHPLIFHFDLPSPLEGVSNW